MDLIYKIDFFILDFIQKFLKCDFLDAVMVFFTKLGDDGIIWIVITLLCLLSDKYRKTGSALTFALVLCLLLGNEVLKESFMRLRPFQQREIQLLIPAPSGYSFPSGHTMSSFAAAFVFYFTHRKFFKWTVILAGLIAFSRIYLCVHFFTDVFVGVLFGILFGYLGAVIIYRKFKFKRH